MPSTWSEADLRLPPEVRPRFASLDAWRQSLDSTAQAYACEVQQAVSGILGAAGRFAEGWRLLCQEVLEGRTEEVQSERDRFLRVFQDQLGLLREARDLAQFAERVAQRDLPETARLAGEAEDLQSKLTRLSSRWQTAEDLEDLAAESIAPSAEKLEAVRRKYGFPQAWYDDSKPF